MEEEKVIDLMSLNKLHNFIITDESGVKRYCSSLIIYVNFFKNVVLNIKFNFQ